MNPNLFKYAYRDYYTPLENSLGNLKRLSYKSWTAGLGRNASKYSASEEAAAEMGAEIFSRYGAESTRQFAQWTTSKGLYEAYAKSGTFRQFVRNPFFKTAAGRASFRSPLSAAPIINRRAFISSLGFGGKMKLGWGGVRAASVNPLSMGLGAAFIAHDFATSKDKIGSLARSGGAALGGAIGAFLGTLTGLPGGTFTGQMIGNIAGSIAVDTFYRGGFKQPPPPKQLRQRMGGFFRESEGALTMRQFAMNEIARTGISGRRLLGQEGYIYHQ